MIHNKNYNDRCIIHQYLDNLHKDIGHIGTVCTKLNYDRGEIAKCVDCHRYLLGKEYMSDDEIPYYCFTCEHCNESICLDWSNSDCYKTYNIKHNNVILIGKNIKINYKKNTPTNDIEFIKSQMETIMKRSDIYVLNSSNYKIIGSMGRKNRKDTKNKLTNIVDNLYEINNYTNKLDNVEIS